jgi:hypothetical protein
VKEEFTKEVTANVQNTLPDEVEDIKDIWNNQKRNK